jgi:hypothetical protein
MASFGRSVLVQRVTPLTSCEAVTGKTSRRHVDEAVTTVEVKFEGESRAREMDHGTDETQDTSTLHDNGVLFLFGDGAE